MFRRPPSLPFAVLAAFAVLALSVAACGETPATTTPAAPTQSEVASAPASATPAPASASSTASSTAGSSASASPTEHGGLSVDPALENRLPSELGNVPLGKQSMTLDMLIKSSPTQPSTKLFKAWATALGVDPNDITYAVATDFADERRILVVALKVKNGTTDRLNSAWRQAARDEGWPVQDQKILEKQLITVVNPTATDPSNQIGYAYSKNDTMYLVVTADQTLLAEALLKLP